MTVPSTVQWIGRSMPETNLLRELVKEAKAGDLQAFERIVVLHQKLVLRVAQRLLLNAEDAKDAAQEVFIRLHRSLGRFQQEQDFGPWLYRMAVNICHDIRRRRKQEISLNGAMEMFDLSPSAEETAVLREQRELVFAALGELTDREREVIVLRDLEGLSTAEVAEITGRLETTVRSQISMGRVKIRNHVAARLRKRSS
jgi:RNA polymerase sigma-70 factor (ECF subfamily)